MTVHFSCQATEKHCMVSLNTVYLEANFMHTIYQLSIHYIYLPITHTVNLYCNKYWFHPYKNIAAHHMNICNTKVTLIITKFTNTRRHEYHYHHIKQTVPSDHIFPPPVTWGLQLGGAACLSLHHTITWLWCALVSREMDFQWKGHTVRTYVKIPILRLGRELQNHTCNSSKMMLICKFIL